MAVELPAGSPRVVKQPLETWLEQWLRRQLFDAHPDGRCVRVSLLHAAGRMRGVRSWPIAEDIDETTMEAMGWEILDAAGNDARDLFGRQRYALAAYRSAHPDQISESKTFTRDGSGANDDADEVDSEPPNQRGLTVQLMRHQEASARTALDAVRLMGKAMSAQIERMTERLVHAEDGQLRTMQLMESLVSERHEREMKDREHQLKMKAWAEMGEKVNLLVPAIVNRLAGQRLLPETTTPLGELLGTFMDSLEKGQIEQLRGVLKPHQFLTVVELLQARQAETAKREAEQRAQQEKATGNGTTTTAGGAT